MSPSRVLVTGMKRVRRRKSALYTHHGGPGKKIARRLFSGGIFIGTRAMLAVAVGPQRVSRTAPWLVVARATHPLLDQSDASVVPLAHPCVRA